MSQVSTGATLAAYQLQQPYSGSPPYTVTVSPAQDTLRLFGNFQLSDRTGGGPSATIALDVTWRISTVQSHTDSTLLELDSDGTRQLTTTQRTDAMATVSASFTWVQVDPAVQPVIAALPGYPAITFATPSPGSFNAQSTETRALSAKANTQEILQSLLPPAQAPRGAQVNFHQQAGSSATLRDAATADVVGNIVLSSGGASPPATASVTMILMPQSGGLLYSDSSPAGVTIQPGNQGADVVLSNLPLADLTGQGFDTTASMNLHWQPQALPNSIVFSRSVTTTPLSTTTAYAVQSTVNADVTGTLAVNGVDTPRITNGSLYEAHSVTIIMPAKGAGKSSGGSTTPQIWQANAIQPWQDAWQTASSADWIKPGPGKKSKKLVTPAAWRQTISFASTRIGN